MSSSGFYWINSNNIPTIHISYDTISEDVLADHCFVLLERIKKAIFMLLSRMTFGRLI